MGIKINICTDQVKTNAVSRIRSYLYDPLVSSDYIERVFFI